ncbi:MAG: hypothetical protein ACRDZ8_20615 [Acidimicrobiales bacterium]
MVTALVGCSKSSKRLGDQPELVAAVKAYLAAESMGFASGNPALAASLASGDAATENQVAAAALQSQMEHGDPTNYAYSVVAVTAFPLDGGATNFISEDTTRDDSDGGIGRYLDLFQRPGPSGTWRVFAGVGLNANIDAPTLRLTAGGAHLLTAAEAQAVGADPQAIASRYVSAMNAGVDTGQLESGTFAPSASTTGVVDSELTFKEIYDLDGSGTLTWTARPGGDDVQLANGVLVFCSAQEVKTINRATYGNTNYFVTQDAQERSFGGLLAPGNYASITETMLVSLAVVVPRSGLPDVVGMDESTTSVTDTLAR